MKITETVYLLASPASWEESGYSYSIASCEIDSYITLDSMEVAMDVPDHLDLTGVHIDLLKTEKQKILAEAGLKAANIEDQIQRLLFIEHKEEE
ncbi:MAG: hypothetical protein V3U97_02710 [bacterium]